MIEKKYKTPNGNILTEGELKNEYGERFDSLVQDNTFMEINLGEGEVKKKELSIPSTTIKTPSESQEPKTKGKPLSVGERPKKTGGSESSTGEVNLFGEAPKSLQDQLISQKNETDKNNKQEPKKKAAVKKTVSTTGVQQQFNQPRTLEQTLNPTLKNTIQVTPATPVEKVILDKQRERDFSKQDGLSDYLLGEEKSFEESLNNEGIFNKAGNFIRGAFNTSLDIASTISPQVAGAIDSSGIRVDETSTQKYIKQAEEKFKEEGVSASPELLKERAKQIKLDEAKKNYTKNKDIEFLQNIKDEKYIDPKSGEEFKLSDALRIDDENKYKSLNKETIEVSNLLKLNDEKRKASFKDLKEINRVLNHQIIFGDFNYATGIYKKLLNKDFKTQSDEDFINYYEANKEKASTSPVNPDLNNIISGLDGELKKTAEEYSSYLTSAVDYIERLDKLTDDTKDVAEDFNNSRRSYDNVFGSKAYFSAAETVNGVVKTIQTLAELSDNISNSIGIPTLIPNSFLFKNVFKNYNYYDFSEQIDRERSLVREDVKEVTDLSSFVNYVSDVTATQSGQMALPMLAGYGKFAMPLLRQSAVYFSSGFGRGVGESENFEERLNRGVLNPGEIGRVHSFTDKVFHGFITGGSDVIGNLPTAIRFSKSFNKVLKNPVEANIFWKSFTTKGLEQAKDFGVELGKEYGEEGLAELFQDASKVFVLNEPGAKIGGSIEDVIKDTTTFTLVSKVFPLLSGGVINRIASSKDQNKITSLEKELIFWKNKLKSDSQVSDNTKKIYADRISKIEKDIESTNISIINKVKKTPGSVSAIEDLNSLISEKMNEANEINNNNELSKEEKKVLLDPLKESYIGLVSNRDAIIEGTKTPFDILSDDAQSKLKIEAADVLKKEEIAKGVEENKINISEETINNKAKEIYESRETTNQEKLTGDNKTSESNVAIQGENKANAQEKVDLLRAEEQKELIESIPNAENALTDGKVDKDKLTNPEDKAKFEEIYDKYDKLISPLLQENKVSSRITDKYTSQEVDRVKALPVDSEDGATMNLDGSKYENGGLVIPLASKNMNASELTAEAIQEFIDENSESVGSDNVKVGIYKFPNSDQVSIDISIVSDRSMREEALAIGKELGQESLYDLDTNENVKTGADGMNPKKLSPKEFKEIQDRLKAPAKTTVDGVTISVSDVDSKTKVSEISDRKISKAVSRAISAVSKLLPNLKFVIHNTDESFRNISGEGKNQESAGMYINGEIHINLQKANARTVAHEIFHAILLDKVKTDFNAQAVTKKMIESIASKIDNNPKLKAKLEEFASMYDENIQDEEKLAELIGMLAENYDSLSARVKDIIKNWINKLANTFGIDAFESNEVFDTLNAIAKKVATGKEITKSDTNIFEGGKVVENPSTSLREQKVGSFDVIYTEQDNIDDLIKKGLVTEPNDTSFMSGEDSAITSPDDMLVGTISIDGKQIFEGGGGVFFVTKYGDVWASGKEGTANTLARAINKSLENNKSGKGYLTLTKGSDSKLISSSSGVKSSLSVLESMLDNELISLSDFRSAVSSAVKLFGGEISLKGSAKQLKQDIDAYFSNPKESTFQKRGDVLNKIIDIIAQSKNTKLNKDKIIEFLGGDANKGIVSKVTSQNKSRNQSLSDLIAGIASEQLTKGLNVGDVYAVIEVSGEVVVKEDSHPSYPFHVVQKDGKKPILHLPKNRENGSKTITTSSGKPYSVGNVSIMSGKFNETTPRQQKTLPTKVSEKLTENKDGDFVFKHYSDQNRDVIKRGQGNNAITSKEEASALSAVGGLAMFYTMEGQKETGVGNIEHTVTISKDKVYDIDTDPLGFEKEARKRFNEVRPGQAFTNNHRGAFITQIANENGFDMAVTQWRGEELRAQTTNELKPSNDTTPFKERPLPTFEVGDKAIIDGKESVIESVEGQKIGYKSVDGTSKGVTLNNERNRRSIIKIDQEVSPRQQKTPEEITRKKSVAAKKNVLAGKTGRLDDSGRSNPLESRMLNLTLINPEVLRNAVSKNLYDKFAEIIQDLSTRRLTIKDLDKDFILNINETYDGIISDYNSELQKIDDIQSKIDSDSTLTESEQSYIDSNKKLFKTKVDETAAKEKKEEREKKDKETRGKISEAVKAVTSYFETSNIKTSSMEFRILNAISSLTKDDIDNMPSEMLQNVLNTLESASDGIMPTYAEDIYVYKVSRDAYNAAKQSSESKKGGVYGSKITGFIPEMRQLIKSFFAGNGKDTIRDRVDSIALFAIDSALKRYNGKVLYENIVSLLAKKVAAHDEKMRRVNKNLEQVYDNLLRDSKSVHISLMKIRYNQLQNMYNLNKDRNNTSGSNTARKFFNKTYNSEKSRYSEDQKKLINEFLKALDNNEFDVDKNGIIKLDGIETNAYETINKEFEDNSINVYEASFFQNGNAAPLVDGYTPVQPNTDSSDTDDFTSISSNFSTPSTKSGNLISKKGSLHPINLNPFSAAISSINSTNIQFELRSEINGILKGLNTYMNELESELSSGKLSDNEKKVVRNKSKETKEIYDAVKNASELLISGNTTQSSVFDTLLDKANNIAYKVYLASGIRTAADFAGNVIAATIQDPMATAKGIEVSNKIDKLDGDVDDNMSTFLLNIQNPQITRVMETKRPSSVNEEFANRGVDSKLTNKNLPSKFQSFIDKVKVKTGFGKVTETARSINEKLTSISDNLPYYHFSIGKFVNEFNKISDEKLDIDAVINDANYLIKNRDLITRAANKANYDVSELMGSKNTFENPLRVTRAKTGNVKGRNGLVRLAVIAGNFLNTFNDRSVDTVGRSINKALSGEEVWENVKKVASQSVRATSYALMINSMLGALMSSLMGDDDEEERLKEGLDNLADNSDFIKKANDFLNNKESNNTYKDRLAFVDKMLENKDFKEIHDILKSYNNRIALGGHVSELSKRIESQYDKGVYEGYLKRIDNKFDNTSDEALVYINSLAYLHSKYGISLYSDKDRDELISKIEEKLEDMNFYMMDFNGPANALYAVDSDEVLDRSQRRGGPLDISLAERSLKLINVYRKEDFMDEMKAQGTKWAMQVAIGRANTLIKGAVGFGVEYFNKQSIDSKFGNGYYDTYKDNLGSPSRLLSDQSLFGYVEQTIYTSLSPTAATVTELLAKSIKNREWQATFQILSIPGMPDLSRIQSKMKKNEIKKATGRKFQENLILDFSKKKFYKTDEEKEADKKAKMTYNSKIYQEKVDGKPKATKKPKSELKFGGK